MFKAGFCSAALCTYLLVTSLCFMPFSAQVSYMHLCTLGLKDWATIGINQQLLDMLSKTPEEQLQDIKKLHEQQEAAKQPSKAS